MSPEIVMFAMANPVCFTILMIAAFIMVIMLFYCFATL